MSNPKLATRVMSPSSSPDKGVLLGIPKGVKQIFAPAAFIRMPIHDSSERLAPHCACRRERSHCVGRVVGGIASLVQLEQEHILLLHHQESAPIGSLQIAAVHAYFMWYRLARLSECAFLAVVIAFSVAMSLKTFPSPPKMVDVSSSIGSFVFSSSHVSQTRIVTGISKLMQFNLIASE
jgi:hypothetical protein